MLPWRQFRDTSLRQEIVLVGISVLTLRSSGVPIRVRANRRAISRVASIRLVLLALSICITRLPHRSAAMSITIRRVVKPPAPPLHGEKLVCCVDVPRYQG
jgi:hypothetical protein